MPIAKAAVYRPGAPTMASRNSFQRVTSVILIHYGRWKVEAEPLNNMEIT